MPKGIVRKIDHLGRITIPIEMRDALGINAKDKLGMYLTDNKINLCNNELQAYTRGLDKLGRWVIPKEIRDTLGFKDNQQLDIYLPGITSGVIQMAKYGCEWCDNTEDLIEVKGHSICRTCAGEVKEIA